MTTTVNNEQLEDTLNGILHAMVARNCPNFVYLHRDTIVNQVPANITPHAIGATFDTRADDDVQVCWCVNAMAECAMEAMQDDLSRSCYMWGRVVSEDGEGGDPTKLLWLVQLWLC